MGLPEAPSTPILNTKLGFLCTSSGSSPVAALWTAVVTQADAILSETGANPKGWAGVATHAIGYAFPDTVAEPLILTGGRIRIPGVRTNETAQPLTLIQSNGALLVEPRTSALNPTHIQPAAFNTWGITLDATLNSALQLDQAAVGGQSHYVTAFIVYVSDSTPTSDVSISLSEAGSNVKWIDIIVAGSPVGTRVGAAFAWPGLKFTANTIARLAGSSPGGGSSSRLHGALMGYTI